MPPKPHILYLASVLPKRSETFVYREILGLRDRGINVTVATVHAPEQNLGDARLDALAEESHALQIYGSGLKGKLAVYTDAAREKLVRPQRGIFETPPKYWMKYGFQAEAGYALAHRIKALQREQNLSAPGGKVWGVTHIHAHFAHVPTTIAMHAAEALNIPFSFTGHAADLFRDRSALETKLRRAAFVSCISHWHREFYKDITPLNDPKLPVIRCGVDLNDFSPADPCLAPKLLAVGRLVPKKGFDTLIRALAICEHKPSPTLTLVGDGPEEQNLRDLAEQQDVADRVSFVGAKDNHTVRDMMAHAALFVLPCQPAQDGDKDGIPVVLMEAMARNLCVISGDLPTIRELVIDRETGRMVQPGDAPALAATIDHLLAEPDNRLRLANAGRAHVANEFSLDVNLDRLEKAFFSADYADCAD